MSHPGEAPRHHPEPRVFFEYCISLVFLTLRRPSRPLRAWRWPWRLVQGLPYTTVTLALGWWGLPWGVIYTPLALWTNLAGGRPLE
jgi:hypothetical protein